MRLLRDVCAERRLAAIVNIHDVTLAQQFMMRIVGLRAGRIVYDGVPSGLTPAVLTDIYGEEDWGPTPDPDRAQNRAAGGPEDHLPEPPTDQDVTRAL
jgi:phosphonate transport system ATP-binding protein